MPCADGYPTEEEIEKLKEYASLPGSELPDIPRLIDHIKKIWWHFEGFWHDGNTLELHTWGWSGNEYIIKVLSKSLFWMFYWEKSERGGHYYFEWRLEDLEREGI